MLRIGSLFSGIGGIELGLSRVKKQDGNPAFEVAWQVELEPYCQRVLEKHWPDVRRWDDIKTFPPPGPIDEWRVDMVTGGFPCPDISNAQTAQTHNRKTVLDGIDGTQSGLWTEMLRVVRILGPRIILLENSSALVVRGLDRILGDLCEGGYDAEWQVISAAQSVGAPQLRKRLFLVAWRDVSDTFGKGLEGAERGVLAQPDNWRHHADSGRSTWWHTTPTIRTLADGATDRLAGRRPTLSAIGNAVVPQVAQFIGEQIVAREEARAEG